jgi:hypothetical protein
MGVFRAKLKVVPGISLKGLRETSRILIKNVPYKGRDLISEGNLTSALRKLTSIHTYKSLNDLKGEKGDRILYPI